MKRGSIALLTFAMVALAEPSTGAPSPVLAYVTSTRDALQVEAFSIRLLYSDGSIGDPLNPPQTSVIDPAWSPDGSRIAFGALPYVCGPGAPCAYGSSAIWVMDADGSNAVQIQTPPPGGYGRGPTWSPDGSSIVYTRKPADEEDDETFPHPDLWVLTDMGGGVWTDEPLIARPGFEYLSDVSPDGQQVAYAYSPDDDGVRREGDPPLDFDLFVAPLDGSGRSRRLTRMEGRQWELDPTWSPDGRRIAFQAARDLWMIRADGSRARRIFESPVESAFPDFSPDGRTIAISQGRKGRNSRILSVAATRPHHVEVLLDVPEVLDMMPAYFPIQ